MEQQGGGPMTRKLDLIYFDAGGGHRSAARALKQAAEDQRRPWDVRLVNLQHLLDPLDPARRLVGVRMEDVYNSMLRSDWTLGAKHMKRLLHLVVRSSHTAQATIMRRFWGVSRPDLVVSLVPHFWIEHQPQHFICGSRLAFEQALEFGHPLSKAWRVSGMIVHPRFYRPPAVDRAAGRRRRGLDPDLPTGLVLFGGQGSMAMLRIATRMAAFSGRVQWIMLCGRNEKVAAQLRAMRGSPRMHVEGFTTEVPEFMELADFFVGKPGPGCLSEALLKGLPVIVERNARTLPQERYNTEWVRENQLGLAIKSFAHIDRAVEHLLAPANLRRYRSNAAALKNRAVFEVVEILDGLLAPLPAPRESAVQAFGPPPLGQYPDPISAWPLI